MQTIENIFGKSLKEIIKPELDLKAKELNIPKRSGLKKEELIEKIIEYVNNPPKTEEKQTYKKPNKKTIPKTLKNMVWDKYIGREKGIGKCNCCNNEIDAKHFECGHVISEATGGSTYIDNLRPICSLCNKSMGIQNMDEFKTKYLQSRQPKCNTCNKLIDECNNESNIKIYQANNINEFGFFERQMKFSDACKEICSEYIIRNNLCNGCLKTIDNCTAINSNKSYKKNDMFPSIMNHTCQEYIKRKNSIFDHFNNFNNGTKVNYSQFW